MMVPAPMNLYTEWDAATPAEALGRMLAGHQVTRMLSVAAELGIADLVHDDPKTSDELARLTRTDAGILHRLLRGLASLGVLARLTGGRFGLTPVGQYLRRDIPGSQRAIAIFSGEEWHQRAWGGLLHSVQTGDTPFDHAFGMPFSAYLAQHPAVARRLDERAAGNTARVADRLARAYDFTTCRRVVDVGGGQGVLLRAVLNANPDLTGVLVDVPAVTAGTPQDPDEAGLAGRCEVVAGDFFQHVPSGGDVYLLKSVIHDWPDNRALTILKNCRRVMADTARLLLIERLVPTDDEPAWEIAVYDLMMLVISGGRERTLVEFRDLLEAAGFRLTSVIPTGTNFSLLEAAPGS